MAKTGDSRNASANPGAFMRRASDEWLSRRVARGDLRAFAALYERYHQPLYRLCLSIVRSPDDARDALQSTFERAFAALRAKEREVAVRPWLFRIAHNESISLLRRRRPDQGPLDVDLPSLQTVEGTYEQRTRLSALVADLDALPERQRSVLLMRELNGLSIEDIAAAMSMSSGAVKQSLFEARGSLHEYAEGRAMACENVRRAISDGDGRALRSRKFRAHLRECTTCAEYRSLMATREADLRLLAPPLPAAAAAAMLSGVIGSGAGAHAGAAAGTPAIAAAKGGAASLALKGVTGLALVAAIGAGAAKIASHSAAHARSSAHARSRGAHTGASHAKLRHASAQATARARTDGTAPHVHHRAARRALPPAFAPAAGGLLESRGAASAGVPVRAHGTPQGVPVHAHGAPAVGHGSSPPASHKPEQPPAQERARTPEHPPSPEHPQTPEAGTGGAGENAEHSETRAKGSSAVAGRA